MKRNIAMALMLLLLCVLLCACGYRDRNSVTAPKQTPDSRVDDRTDMMPDPEDGIIDDNAGRDGFVSGEGEEIGGEDSVLDESYLTTPNPKASMKP